MNKINLGTIIKNKRMKLKISQEKLAEKLDVSTRSISRWENNICMPNHQHSKLIWLELKIKNITKHNKN